MSGTAPTRRQRAMRGALFVVQATGCAGVVWAGWHVERAAHAAACALPATAFEVGKQLLCGGPARDLAVVMLTAMSPLFVLAVAVGIAARRRP